MTYSANFPGNVIYGDVTKIPVETIPAFDVLLAGLPCQTFSKSGRKEGFLDRRGTLFFQVAEIVKHHKPRAIILENVPNLLTHDEGRTFKVICATLNNLGYDIHHQMLNAKDFGIPQNRRRIFIVCLRKAVGEDGPLNRFSFPTPPKTPTLVGDILETQVDPKYTISGRRWKGLRERRQRNSQAGKGFGYSLTSGMSVYNEHPYSEIPQRWFGDIDRAAR